ncbi:inactive histone-lysine N-methyltransferase 2E-like [Amphiprion ocellaris]|uniref:inactive histone-lysine N-methyltransferase 2E-like n=1 Tax=Amphiprion ocellaris TaxID=80972 RepID=UPI0024113337|nr:inactive histone-lysine N-methyltransferase 2E-like [Amphiprion ocellaris]
MQNFMLLLEGTKRDLTSNTSVPSKDVASLQLLHLKKESFLLEYRGELINKQECEKRQRLYHSSLKVFMFEFRFNGKLWCVDAAKEDGSLGRLVNDDHINPNTKMKYFSVQGKPHLCLFAIRDISPGEEITYNYGDSDWPWRSKDLDEEMPQKSPETESPPSTKEVVEQKKTSEKIQTSPVLDVLTVVGKALDEKIIQETPKTTSSTSTNETVEQMTSDNSQIEMAMSNLSQARPVLDLVTRVEKDLDEEMPQKSPETTNSPSTKEVVEQMTNEKSQIERTVSDLNQTSPVLDVLTVVGKDLDEEMPQKSPETTNYPSTKEVVEQMTSHKSQIERTVSDLNQTSPMLDVLTMVGKDLDEEMPQKSPDTTNSPSTKEVVEQMTSHKSQIEWTVSDLNQTSPMLGVLTVVGKDLDEEMPQTSPDTTNSPSTKEVVEQMTSHKSQIEWTVSDLNQTSPMLDVLTVVGKDLDEEMPQKSPETTNSPSTKEVVEQMTNEKSQIERTVSDLNQTSPVLDVLTVVGKALDEKIIQETPKTTSSTSTNETVEQMTSDNSQIEMAMSNLSQARPVIDLVTRVEKDLDEEMPQKSPETTNSPSTKEVVEQMTSHKSQIERTVSDLNQTSPMLDVLTVVGKDLDEEMPQKSPETTNSPSTKEVVEQV